MEPGVERVVRVLLGGAAIRPSVGAPPNHVLLPESGFSERGGEPVCSSMTCSFRVVVGSGWSAAGSQRGGLAVEVWGAVGDRVAGDPGGAGSTWCPGGGLLGYTAALWALNGFSAPGL